MQDLRFLVHINNSAHLHSFCGRGQFHNEGKDKRSTQKRELTRKRKRDALIGPKRAKNQIPIKLFPQEPATEFDHDSGDDNNGQMERAVSADPLEVDK